MNRAIQFRRNDFNLDEDQKAVRDSFRTFFEKECPPSAVRAAEPLGHDAGLWSSLLGLGVTSMALPAEAGGDAASFVDLVLVAEEYGSALAPVPFISQAVTARLLAGTDAPCAGEALAGVVSGERPVTLAPQPGSGRRQLVPDAALARDVIVLDGDSLLLVTLPEPPAQVANTGRTPLAWLEPDRGEKQVLAQGPLAAELHARAIQEWKLLTAAALVSLTEKAMFAAAEFAKTRMTLGVPIGTLQGISFPLADIAINVAGTRNLVRKAAWMHEYEPGVRPDLIPMAYATAARIAGHGTSAAMHVFGGLGVSAEADAVLYFTRAKGWTLLLGDPGEDYRILGDLLASGAI